MTPVAEDEGLDPELAGPLAVASLPEDPDPTERVGEPAAAPEDTGTDPLEADLPGPTPAREPDEDPSAVPWRLAGCLTQLRAEQNALWPHRDRTSDGTIGDARHAAERSSDHNPWVKDPDGVGVVRAADTDVDGFPAAAFAEHVRRLGAEGDKRLNPGGYVIYNRRIASWTHGWEWRLYTGDNPHTVEVHVSVTTNYPAYHSKSSWRLADLLRAVHRHATPTISRGRSNPPAAVKDLQGHLNAWRRNRPPLSVHPVDGVWDEWLEIALRTFQRAYGLTVDGICGDTTWRVVHTITKGARA